MLSRLAEPTRYRWIVPRRLAVAERPGGGGRSHRVARREQELAWWHDQHITTIVSLLSTRHGLLEPALAGFRALWHPLLDTNQGGDELIRVARQVRMLLDGSECVLVHADQPGEWLAAADIVLQQTVLDTSLTDATATTTFPVGDITHALLDARHARANDPDPHR